MIHDEPTQRAVARLVNNPDFALFMQCLAEEQESSLAALLASKDTVMVHQLQGATRVLMDIKQSVRAAPHAAAMRSRNT